MFDLLIRGGTVIDGTGAPAFVGDVAIVGDRIVEVGPNVEGDALRVVDASGLLVTPGFVDMHTHYDGQATWDPYFTPSGWHGVTTVVMGNCGVGFAPCRDQDRDWLIDVMEGVEDIPGSALSTGIQWDWQTFPEYLDALERLPHAIDYATQIPHSALRAWVMGRDASEQDQATPEQLVEMKSMVRAALDAGALGFTTSRTTLHKSAAGNFVAGTFAALHELEVICEAIAESGKGLFSLANEHFKMKEDAQWLKGLAARMGRPVLFNLSQTDFTPVLYKELLAVLEEAQHEGAPLFAQAAGRAIGVLMSWRTTAHPFVLHPSFMAIAGLPWEQQLEQLRDPAFKAKLLAETPEQRGVFEAYITQSFSKMWAFRSAEDYEPHPDDCLASRAKSLGVAANELAYDALMAEDGTAFLYFPLFNYTNGSLDVLHELHQHPRVLMGLSDGGAHCGAICDAGMPSFMLTHWARDRTRGPKLPLEYMVMRQTSQTADIYGLCDRGRLAPGLKADVNLIDFDDMALDNPRLVFDLPAQGRRLVQRASGYRMTLCSGQVIFEHGQATGLMPGKLVRGAQQAPSAAAAK